MNALRSWRVWLVSVSAAALLTALTTAQAYASRRLEGLPARVDGILPIQAIDWFAWALLAPVMLTVASLVAPRTHLRVRFGLRWVGIGLGFAGLHALLEVITARSLGYVPREMPFTTMLPARAAGTLVGSLIVVCLVALSYYAVSSYRDGLLREQREATLEARLAEAQLNVLRHQLQPHFLFNTLHTISALITDDVGAARRVIARLGDLLRSSLDTAELHEVPLSQELLFLGHYLEIQRTRFGERLRVEIVSDPSLVGALVPSMLLQPLVENAIRHAVEPRAGGGSVRVSARRENGLVVLEVNDDGPGIGANAQGVRGVGIANTRARLATLYGGSHQFTMENAAGGGLRVVMKIAHREG
jgi:signal transduction histidine kinase